MFTGEQGGKLNQPRGRLHRQGVDDRVSVRTSAQLTERFEHRVIRFLTSVRFDALSAPDAKVRDIERGLSLELVDERGFADAGLPGDEDDLRLVLHRALEGCAQRREGAISAYQPASGRGHRQTRRGPVADWGDEAVPAPG